LSVSFTVASSGNVLTAQVTILVYSPVTTLIWNSPSPITHPTPVDGTQLNAVGSVPGTYSYSPGLNSILDPGTHELTVVFTPTDSNYPPVSGRVTLIVNPEAIALPLIINPPSDPNATTKTLELNSTNDSSVKVTQQGEGVDLVTLHGTQADIKTAPSFSGHTSVQVTITTNGLVQVENIPVTVNPVPEPTLVGPTSIMNPKSLLSWQASPNATSYVVKIRGVVVCTTTTTSCSVDTIVGPSTQVEVTEIGGGDTQTIVIPTFHLEKPLPALVVNFANNSSKLTLSAMTELKRIAEIVKTEGFTKLVVYGHTDINRGVDNKALSSARANTTKSYLEKLLPSVNFTVGAFASSKPVDRGKNAKALASNRRAEISIW